jgi:t-SNARE complex subunit (syntaxin)
VLREIFNHMREVIAYDWRESRNRRLRILQIIIIILVFHVGWLLILMLNLVLMSKWAFF